MYKVRLDITGETYGFLRAVEYRGKTSHNQAIWSFVCIAPGCGRVVEAPAFHVRNGSKRSCGCATNALKSEGKKKHGIAHTPEYTSYRAMLDRCTNTNNPLFHRYGGRGIAICERWLGVDGPANFYADMGQKPSANHSIERVDNDGNYEPSNCVWATRAEQMQTRSTTRLIEFGGKAMSIAAWERHLGFGLGVVRDRLNRGWPVDEALTRLPSKKRRSGSQSSGGQNQPCL